MLISRRTRCFSCFLIAFLLHAVNCTVISSANNQDSSGNLIPSGNSQEDADEHNHGHDHSHNHSHDDVEANVNQKGGGDQDDVDGHDDHGVEDGHDHDTHSDEDGHDGHNHEDEHGHGDDHEHQDHGAAEDDQSHKDGHEHSDHHGDEEDHDHDDRGDEDDHDHSDHQGDDNHGDEDDHDHDAHGDEDDHDHSDHHGDVDHGDEDDPDHDDHGDEDDHDHSDHHGDDDHGDEDDHDHAAHGDEDDHDHSDHHGDVDHGDEDDHDHDDHGDEDDHDHSDHHGDGDHVDEDDHDHDDHGDEDNHDHGDEDDHDPRDHHGDDDHADEDDHDHDDHADEDDHDHSDHHGDEDHVDEDDHDHDDHGDEDDHDHSDNHGDEDDHDHADHGDEDDHDHDDQGDEEDHDHSDHHEDDGHGDEDDHDHGEHDHSDEEDHDHSDHHEDDGHGDEDDHDHGEHDHGDEDEHDHGEHDHGDEDGHDHEDHGDEDDHDGHDHEDEHEHGDDHEHHDHQKASFTKLLTELSTTVMNNEALSNFLKKLRESIHCEHGDEKKKDICKDCITVEHLRTAADIEDSRLDKHHFEKVAFILVYYLKSENNETCLNQKELISYTEAKAALVPAEEICEKQFSRIITEISDHSCEEAIRCVENTSPFHDECIKMDEIEESELMTGVLLSIINCKCELPEPDYFVKELMEIGDSKDGIVTLEGFQNLLERLKIGGKIEVVEDSHAGHNHKRRKRETGEEEDHDHVDNACYTAEELFAIYNIEKSRGINETQMTYLSPALIQQIVSEVCVAKAASSLTDPNYTDAMKYGYGTASVLIISCLAFLGLLVFPAIGTATYRMTMQFFIALGVGTMSGDALLHIIPEAVGLHEHGPGEVHSEDEDRTYLWRLLTVVGGIYLFYLFENTVRLINAKRNTNFTLHVHDHGGDHDHTVENGNARSTSHTTTSIPAAGSENVTDLDDKNEKSIENKEKEEMESQKVIGDLTAISMMVLIGDILHNFGDGIAIGVAFSSSWTTGVGTSIAIFCHELPHEFGDFAIYLRNGLSKWKALGANFAAACMAFVGLYIGLGIASNPEARKWIMAAIAGMFLYICLVDVLHEMIESKTTTPVLQFVLQNVGLLLGWAILLVIAIYEDSLRNLTV